MNVAVLYGGISAEREVSLSSGRQIIAALREAGFDVTPIEVTQDLPATIGALAAARPDAVFNALHGRFGEDGCIQGVLDWMGLPYTHSGVRASAVAMDKAAAKAVFRAHGPAGGRASRRFARGAGRGRPAAAALRGQAGGRGQQRRRHHPARGRQPAPRDRPRLAARPPHHGGKLHPRPRADRGRDGRPRPGRHRDRHRHVFYDYDAKYAEGGSRHVLPAAIHPEVAAEAMRVALAAHRALGCRGVSRSDFRYDDTAGEPGRLVLLEVNTQPGMTPTSLLPEQAAHLGIPFPALCRWIVEQARHGA
jgi:D-alanine-D-alanine ligase